MTCYTFYLDVLSVFVSNTCMYIFHVSTFIPPLKLTNKNNLFVHHFSFHKNISYVLKLNVAVEGDALCAHYHC